jgi:Hypothetical protein (DUF2513)
MKRDMELIRHLMLEVESQDSDFQYASLQKMGYTEAQIDYHLQLLIEEGLIDGEVIPLHGSPDISMTIVISKLSWKGHEFLDNARNESVWKETMKTVKEKGGSVAVGVLIQLLASEAKKHLGLS